MKPLGILGGTFDPVHHGHLRLAVECLERAGLDEVRLMPVHTPPHRRVPVASPAERLRMLHIATEGTAGLVVDDREVRRGGVSYTIDTLEAMRGELGERPLCLIMGMDSYQSLQTWKRWEALITQAHFIIARRNAGTPPPQGNGTGELLRARSVDDPVELAEAPAGRIYISEMPMLDIAASRIRASIAAERDVRFLLPRGVLDYISREGLYRNVP